MHCRNPSSMTYTHALCFLFSRAGLNIFDKMNFQLNILFQWNITLWNENKCQNLKSDHKMELSSSGGLYWWVQEEETPSIGHSESKKTTLMAQQKYMAKFWGKSEVYVLPSFCTSRPGSHLTGPVELSQCKICVRGGWGSLYVNYVDFLIFSLPSPPLTYWYITYNSLYFSSEFGS